MDQNLQQQFERCLQHVALAESESRFCLLLPALTGLQSSWASFRCRTDTDSAPPLQFAWAAGTMVPKHPMYRTRTLGL